MQQARGGEGRGGACSGGSPGIGSHRILAAAALASDWLPQLGLAGRAGRGSLAPSWRAGRPPGARRGKTSRGIGIFIGGGGGGGGGLSGTSNGSGPLFVRFHAPYFFFPPADENQPVETAENVELTPVAPRLLCAAVKRFVLFVCLFLNLIPSPPPSFAALISTSFGSEWGTN